VGDERGAAGTPHLQMAFRFHKQIDHMAARHVIGMRVRIEPMRESIAINIKYCSKEKVLCERGIRPEEKGKAGGNAHKRKWDDVKEDLKKGMTQIEMADKYTELVIKHGDGLSKVRNLYQGKIARKPVKVMWYHGETGAGKSFRAEEEAKADGRPLYRQNGSSWWDAYDGEPLVIIDDINPRYDFKDLLKHLDQYNVLIPCKGSHMWLKAEKIWVTSSFPPSTIDLGGQLDRRITTFEMKKANRPDIRNMLGMAGFSDRDLEIVKNIEGGMSPYSAFNGDE